MSHIPYNSPDQPGIGIAEKPDLRKAVPASALIASFVFIAGVLIFL